MTLKGRNGLLVPEEGVVGGVVDEEEGNEDELRTRQVMIRVLIRRNTAKGLVGLSLSD